MPKPPMRPRLTRWDGGGGGLTSRTSMVRAESYHPERRRAVSSRVRAVRLERRKWRRSPDLARIAPGGRRSCCTHPRRRTREFILRHATRRPARLPRERQSPPPHRSSAASCALLGVPMALGLLALLVG